MKIQNIKINDIANIANELNNTQHISENELRELLSILNISFFIENANRLQSMLICELGDSYVQQSQRYVKSDAYSIDMFKGTKFYSEANDLINKSIDLYTRMTELKDKDKKGRLVKDDFKYGIPYEDARYIFPLAMYTNITVTMTGDKLIDLYRLFMRHPSLFYNCIHQFVNSPCGWIHNHIMRICSFTAYYKISQRYYSDIFREIKHDEILVIDGGTSYDNVVLGGLTSTNIDPKSNLETMTHEDKEKFIDRVAYGYGHKGILEQSRTTLGMCLSLSAYHQYIRHRLNNNIREDLKNIVTDGVRRGFYIPESINNSEFCMEYTIIVAEYCDFLNRAINSMHIDDIGCMMLNCMYIKFISSSNARNDAFLFRERLCMTAQTEIREMMEKKYTVLKSISPQIYNKAVPPCVYEQCKEGKMSCGKANEMRFKYKVK